MNERTIREMFNRNWVFKLYKVRIGRYRLSYQATSALISIGIFLIGLFGAAFYNAIPDYLLSVSPWLHLGGVFIVFYSFDWFITRLIRILDSLKETFDVNSEIYEKAIRVPVDSIGNRFVYMILAGLFFAILNIVEINAIWKAEFVPIPMQRWVNSPAQLYFRIFYTFTHGLVIPFLLGSGVIGLIGYIALIYHLFQLPVRLQFHQATSQVVEWTTGLVMWTLMALGLILTLSRPLLFFSVNIKEIVLSGGIQAALALILAVLVGVVPLLAIYKAITKAKKEELAGWYRLRVAASNSLKAILTDVYLSSHKEYSDPGLAPGDEANAMKIERTNRDIQAIDKEIARINEIPGLPIRWPSILRVAFGSAFSIGIPILKDFLLANRAN